MVRLAEMTFSNLRVPMFAHAGDSEDEEEDREPLVAAVEDSDEEENERREGERKQTLLYLSGQWGGSSSISINLS